MKNLEKLDEQLLKDLIKNKSPNEQMKIKIMLSFLDRFSQKEMADIFNKDLPDVKKIKEVNNLFRAKTTCFSWAPQTHTIGLIKTKSDCFEFKTVETWNECHSLGSPNNFNNCCKNPDTWTRYHKCEAMLILIKKSGVNHALVTINYQEDRIEIEDVLGYENKVVKESAEIQSEMAKIILKRVPNFIEVYCEHGSFKKLPNREVMLEQNNSRIDLDIQEVMRRGRNRRRIHVHRV